MICYISSQSTASTVSCFDTSDGSLTTYATTTQSLNLVTVSSLAVCWQTIQGQAYCYSFLNDTIDQINSQSQISSIGTGIQPGSFSYFAATLDARTGSLSQNLLSSQFSFSDLVFTSDNNICAIYPSAQSFSCLPSLTSFSENLNPAGFGTGSITQFAINTNTTIWVNSNGQLGGFGLYSCPTNAPSCTNLFDDAGILPTPALSNVTRVAVGNGMGCAVYNNLVNCWGAGSTTNPSITGLFASTNVADVAVFDTGLCIQNSNGTIICSGTTGYDFTTNTLYVPNDCLPCASYSLAAANTCFPCNVGNDLIFNNTIECVPCPLGYFRGYSETSCTLCPIGSATNYIQSQCLPCPPAFYWSNSMCIECPAGSTSINFTQCTACPHLTARPLGQLQCQSCTNLSMPSIDQSFCQSCTLPYYLTYNSLTQFTFADGTCTRCPDGYYVTPFNFSCSLCTYSTIRTGTQPECINCPNGSASDIFHTICEPCVQGTVRANTDPECYVCPSGLAPQNKTICVPYQQSPIINPIRAVAYTVGAAIIAFALLFKHELSLTSLIILLKIGIGAMLAAGFVQTIQSKENLN